MRDEFSRHYTQELFADFLVSKLGTINPSNALDLGVGQASLSKALKKKWKKIKITAVDIDPLVLKKLPVNKNFEILNENCLSFKSFNFFQLRNNSYEIAVCNPPYRQLSLNLFRKKLLFQTNFHNTLKMKSITSDIYFLAKNLMALKENGILGIIMPDTVITGNLFEPFRKDLVSNYNILGCFQLPPSVFSKTEAQAHILIIQNTSASTSNYISVSRLSKSAEVIKTVLFTKENAIKRLDFNSFNNYSKPKDNFKTLKECGFTITRGQINKSEIKNITPHYFHTTSFKNYNDKDVILINSPKMKNNLILTKPGAILFARVGTRCLAKNVIVKKGRQYFTDCIFQIEAPTIKLRELFLKELNSASGERWIHSHAKGVCAKSISISELINFPLRIKN